MVWDGTDSALPAINVYKTSAQSVATGVSAGILFNVTRAASGGMTLNANGWVKVPRTGWYQCNGNVTFAASTSSARRIVGIASSANPSGGFGALTGTILASAQDTSNISALGSAGAFYLTQDTFVTMWVNASANWGLDVSNAYMTTLSVAWLGPG